MAITRKITFEYRPNAGMGTKPYHCVKIINSTEYKPGEWFDAETVENLCRSNHWDVTITT
jgi:hypothetical protein